MNRPVCAKDFEEFAKNYLPKNALDYYQSGADDEYSLQDNTISFKRQLVVMKGKICLIFFYRSQEKLDDIALFSYYFIPIITVCHAILYKSCSYINSWPQYEMLMMLLLLLLPMFIQLFSILGSHLPPRFIHERCRVSRQKCLCIVHQHIFIFIYCAQMENTPENVTKCRCSRPAYVSSWTCSTISCLCSSYRYA